VKRLCLLLVLCLGWPLAAQAQQTAEKSDTYQVHTGDEWVDAQLQDINHYAERFPDSFLDEAGTPATSTSPVSGARSPSIPAATACAPSAAMYRKRAGSCSGPMW